MVKIEIDKKTVVFFCFILTYAFILPHIDFSFITKTHYFQGEFPIGAMLYLMLYSVVKELVVLAGAVYLGYHIGRYFQKREDRRQ